MTIFGGRTPFLAEVASANTPAVLVYDPITPATLKLLQRTLQKCPRASLAIFDHSMRPRPLDYVLDLPPVRRLAIHGYHTKSLEPIEQLAGRLTSLSLGPFKTRMDIGLLRGFRSLESLDLDGGFQDLGPISQIPALQSLYLRSSKFDSLECLGSIKTLRWLWVGLGSSKSIAGIETLPRLSYLELWRIRGLSDVRPIAACTRLRALTLDSFTRPVEFPSLRELRVLSRVDLLNMPALRDLRPIAAAPKLRELCVGGTMSKPRIHLLPKSFDCFRGHPTLAAIGGSEIAEIAARRLKLKPRLSTPLPAARSAR